MDAKPFARELALLRELPQREAKVCERLGELPPEAAVELLHDLVRLAEESDDDARVALIACVKLQRYESTLGYERLAEIYVIADDRGYEDVKALLTTSQVQRKAPRDGVENEFVEKTLGERKSMARNTRDRDLLDRLLFDKNPEVVRLLLANPRVIERDVIKMASMRPTSPGLLFEIVKHARWSTNYAVKKTLALNPYLPVNDAVALLPFLLKQDLEEIAAGLEIHPKVASAAREIVDRRNPIGSN